MTKIIKIGMKKFINGSPPTQKVHLLGTISLQTKSVDQKSYALWQLRMYDHNMLCGVLESLSVVEWYELSNCSIKGGLYL